MHICEYLHKNLHFCGAFSSGSAGGVFPKRDVLTPKFYRRGCVRFYRPDIREVWKINLFTDVRCLILLCIVNNKTMMKRLWGLENKYHKCESM